MARDHARLDLHIWTDDHYRVLSTPAKLVYLQLVSQPKLSYAGVLDLAVKRWAQAHPDLGVDGVRAALAELDAERFIVVDHDTEELLVRSFIRRDELWKQPNMLRGALRVAFEIVSPILRAALAVELRRLPVEVTGPAPVVAAAELETGALAITPAVKAALTVRGSGRPAPAPTAPEHPTLPFDTDPAEQTIAHEHRRSQGTANPSVTPSRMDLGEGSGERVTSLGPVAFGEKVGVPAPTHVSAPPRAGTPTRETAPPTEPDQAGREAGSVRAVRRAEAERLVTVHAPAQPRRVLDRLRGEVIGLLADGIDAASIAAGLRIWAGKRLAVSFLPELVGEHMRATTTPSTPDTRRKAVAAAEAFEQIRADAIADDDRSPVGLAVRGELPAHADPAELDKLLARALDAALPEQHGRELVAA